MKFGELWDPYATLESVAPTMKLKQPLAKSESRRPNEVPLQLGIGCAYPAGSRLARYRCLTCPLLSRLGQLWRPDPRSSARSSEQQLLLRDTPVQMDPTTRRMIVFLLEKCRLKSTALFKTMKASDTPNPATVASRY